MSANDKYLLVIVDDVNTVSVVDVDGPPVLILQRGPHQHVSEAVVVEVWSSCQCITKPGILGLFLRLESSIRDKHLLLEEKKERKMEELEVTGYVSRDKEAGIIISLLRK